MRLTSATEGDMHIPSAIDVAGVSKAFGGVQALSDVTFGVPEAHVTSLIGPNGAGKTTLFNIVSGISRPDSGTVRFRGQDVTSWPSHHICKQGLGRTFQNIRLFPSMTAIENVHVAAMTAQADGTDHLTRAVELLEFVGIAHLSGRMPGQLSYGDRRRLEIARALATRPLTLMLDEPAAGMIRSEVDALVRLIDRLRKDGLTVILIEHNVDMVMGISDHVVVFNFGRKIAEGPPEAVRHDRAVQEAYLGV